MRTMRKLLGFMLAVGLMVSAMSVFASGGYSYTDAPAGVEYEYFEDHDYSQGGLIENGNYYRGLYVPTGVKAGTEWMDMNPGPGQGNSYEFDGKNWVHVSTRIVYNGPGLASGGSSKSKSDSDSKSALEKEAEERAAAEAEKERLIQEQASRDAVRLAGAASDEGFADIGDMYIATQKSMSAGEFYNNAVVSTPGIENAVTVGQGGNLVVNGEVTNMSATITKVTNRAYVDSVRIEQEGRVLNVVDVSYPATEATINFYMPGITGEETIAALQYNAGRWVEIEVAEVRADHVVLNMKGNGVVAFIAK